MSASCRHQRANQRPPFQEQLFGSLCSLLSLLLLLPASIFFLFNLNWDTAGLLLRSQTAWKSSSEWTPEEEAFVLADAETSINCLFGFSNPWLNSTPLDWSGSRGGAEGDRLPPAGPHAIVSFTSYILWMFTPLFGRTRWLHCSLFGWRWRSEKERKKKKKGLLCGSLTKGRRAWLHVSVMIWRPPSAAGVTFDRKQQLHKHWVHDLVWKTLLDFLSIQQKQTINLHV